MSARSAFVGVILILTAVLRPVPGRGQAVTVSADSILATARDLSGETGIGPPSRIATRLSSEIYAEYLRDRLQAILAPLGGRAYLQHFDSGLPAFPGVVRTRFANVIGVLPGALGPDATGTFCLSGHWDSTSERELSLGNDWDPRTSPAPGADDNGSGVATILEAVRVMAARGIRPQADLMIAFFDGEERQYQYDPDADAFTFSGMSLVGSGHLTDSLAAAGTNVFADVTADMVSYNPRVDSLVVVTNAASQWVADAILAVPGGPSGWASDLQLARYVRGLNNSDHARFWQAGYDGVLVFETVEIGEHAVAYYHKTNDIVANSYSRNGSMAAQTAELLTGLLESWSWSAADSTPSLLVTGEDIHVQQGTFVDIPTSKVGTEVTVNTGFTNRGGTYTGSWSLTLDLQDMDGRRIRSLGTESQTGTLPAGGRVKVRFPWLPESGERGAVRLAVTLAGNGQTLAANRIHAVEGAPLEVPHAYVYPNPTRDPASAVVRYDLTRAGSVRLSVLDLDGRRLAEHDEEYDPSATGPTVDPGMAEVPLSRVLGGVSLSAGLYLLRVEAFRPEGGAADVAIGRFLVLR
jgi:hypothetical protein